ncbi:MAG: ABC transporter permease [Deltaproteobacteria bacterium]|nr:ABC transporter permease [Deltaproteobacteria bacterium]
MRRYIIIRLFQTVVTLVILSIVIFVLVRLGGDPAILMLPETATQEDYQYMKKQLGLDKPIYYQYGVFFINACKRDLGKSIRTGKPVVSSIMEVLPNSLKLVTVAFIIGFALSIPLGVIAAVKKDTIWDNFARMVAGLGQSLPTFWVGLVMIQVFVVWLNILPAYGMGTWQHYLMPATCMGIFLMAGVARLLRSSMLEVLDSEYIKMARIKGVKESIVIWKHALRNSLLSVVSFGGIYIAILITGAILIETVFAWPGFGRLAYTAIINQDFPLIQGVVLTAGALVMVSNFITDIFYAYLDPRIRIQV